MYLLHVILGKLKTGSVVKLLKNKLTNHIEKTQDASKLWRKFQLKQTL